VIRIMFSENKASTFPSSDCSVETPRRSGIGSLPRRSRRGWRSLPLIAASLDSHRALSMTPSHCCPCNNFDTLDTGEWTSSHISRRSGGCRANGTGFGAGFALDHYFLINLAVHCSRNVPARTEAETLIATG
jgi:hypothetical protein